MSEQMRHRGTTIKAGSKGRTRSDFGSINASVSFTVGSDDLSNMLNPSMQRSTYARFKHRIESDNRYAEANFDLSALDEGLDKKYETRDYHDMPDVNPSFTNFKIPLEIVSHQRYLRNVVEYEKEFRREIQNLIDFQTTALEASCFVRIMSYTTFWPPLHNRHELEHTSNNFFQLTPTEKSRLDYIMSHEFR